MHGYQQHENAPSRVPSYDGLAADNNDGKGGAMWDACPPFTSHQRDQLARQMVPEVLCDGRLAHWPARGFALGTTSIATQRTTSGPGHRAMTQLRRAVCGNVFVDSLGAITFDPADLHGYTATCLFGGQEVG